MCMWKGGTAEELFSTIDNCMSSIGISRDNCVPVGVDNGRVNMGNTNSIMTRVLAQNSSVYFNGCPYHTVHNKSASASSAFSCATGFDVADFMDDLYYWFDYSTKRENKLAEFAESGISKDSKACEHKSISRMLKQYPSLKSYARFKRLQDVFSDPMTGVYLLFMQSSLQIFFQLNLFLQRDEPDNEEISTSPGMQVCCSSHF